jgi:flagellar biosynthesis protein FlhB
MTSKTEAATDKKKLDASKRGEVWRSADISSLTLLAGVTCLLSGGITIEPAMREMLVFAENGFVGNMSDILWRVSAIGARALVLLYGVAIVLSIIPSLLMSRFSFGSEVIKLDFAALSPAAGFKRIFNRKNFKDAVKACLYFLLFGFAGLSFWSGHRIEILSLARMTPATAFLRMTHLLSTLTFTLLAVALSLALGDMLFSYLLYLRDLKMTRSEVKREHKDTQGSEEIKQERKRITRQLLESDVKRDVEQSAMVIANPTHIAVGLYMNFDVSPLPFISVMETDARALAVISHAKKMNIPVVRNISLARKLFANHKRYSFVAIDELEEITDVIKWLTEVEVSRAESLGFEPIDDAGGEEVELDAAADTAPDETGHAHAKRPH